MMFMDYIQGITNSNMGLHYIFKICTVFVEVTILLVLKLVIGIYYYYIHHSILNLVTLLQVQYLLNHSLSYKFL